VERATRYALGFVAVQIGLENLYKLFPVENYAQLHTAITTGILDNILPALFIFILCWKYLRNELITLLALTWLVIETIDGIVRVFLQFAIYYADDQSFAYRINESWLLPAYWLYVLIPIIWLMLIRRNFTLKPSDPYGDGAYLYFRRPKTITDYLVSFFGGSTSTVFPVVDGCYYHFCKGHPFAKAKFKKGMLKEGRLVRINPPKGFKAFLESRVGVRYHIISRNCVTILRGSGLRIGKLDFVPSIFMMRYK